VSGGFALAAVTNRVIELQGGLIKEGKVHRGGVVRGGAVHGGYSGVAATVKSCVRIQQGSQQSKGGATLQ
jgi:hypothetical protein